MYLLTPEAAEKVMATGLTVEALARALDTEKDYLQRVLARTAEPSIKLIAAMSNIGLDAAISKTISKTAPRSAA